MLKELKFVQGAVARKDLLPAMTHFKIENGFVRSYNGTMALCSPLPFDINCVPKAEPMVKAIGNCKETVTLNMTDGGRLRIQSGKFRAFIECIEGDTPHVEPAGQRVDINGEEFLNACRVLYPFVGNDASRQWTNGILLSGQSAYATNNVCLVEYWLAHPFPFVVNVPRMAIKEVLRINEPPTHLQLEQSSITFHYTDGRWIRSQLFDTEGNWHKVADILDAECDPRPIPEELFEGLKTLNPLTEGLGTVYIRKGELRTHLQEQTGGVYEVPELDFEGAYQIGMLALLEGVVTRADFRSHPQPALFFGKAVRGAIMGLRDA